MAGKDIGRCSTRIGLPKRRLCSRSQRILNGRNVGFPCATDTRKTSALVLVQHIRAPLRGTRSRIDSVPTALTEPRPIVPGPGAFDVCSGGARGSRPFQSIRAGRAPRSDAPRMRYRGRHFGSDATLRVDLIVQADHSLDRAQGGLEIGLIQIRRFVEMQGVRIYARGDGRGKSSGFLRCPTFARLASVKACAPKVLRQARASCFG
jgi:hypothetical protein